MCQLCKIKAIATSERWPKPLDPTVQEILGTIPTAHKEAMDFNASRDLQQKMNSSIRKETKSRSKSEAEKKNESDDKAGSEKESFSDNKTPPSSPAASTKATQTAQSKLLETLEILTTTLALLSDARIEWWNSPAKKKQRRELSEAFETAKLTELQKINQRCVDMIANISAVLGGFRKWNLDGFDPGLVDDVASMKINDTG